MSSRKQQDILHVILGNMGDCCIALPTLKRWADENGRPASVLTSKYCAPLFEGCSYVKAVAMEGTYHDLPATLALLKTDAPQQPVKNLQFYGSGAEKTLPSFWHEQMYLAGLLGGGEDEPLVFDRRDERREGMLRVDCMAPRGVDVPMILVALEGKSSPLNPNAKRALWHAISELGNECNIVWLEDVKVERVYDLLGLYDHAAALISIDTVHLHLSKASKVPVFALARDYPERWHGTPQLERFAWYCRYGQAMERADELIAAIRDTLNGATKPKPEFIPLPRGAYNPSIIRHEGENLISYRYHPDPLKWRTQLVLDGLPVKFPYPVSQCAHEDMRLFEYQGKLWASYVCARGSMTRPRCVTGYGELVREKEFWAVREHFQPAMFGNHWQGMQKNMVCFEHDGKIFAIWRNGLVIELMRNLAPMEWESEPATWPYGEIRGGTSPLPFRGKWLRFFHSRIWDRENGRPWRYHVGALLMEPNPPFNVVAVSSRPIISGDESGDPMIPHWKHSVAIVYGAVQDDEGWTLSLGINDAHSALLRIKESDLNL